MTGNSTIRTEFSAQAGGSPPDVGPFIAAVGNKYQHLVIAEDNPLNFRQDGRALLTNPAFYQGLKNAGIGHFILQLPSSEQELCHAYCNKDKEFFRVDTPDKITPALFVMHMKGNMPVAEGDFSGNLERKLQLANMLDLCRANKIQPLVVDHFPASTGPIDHRAVSMQEQGQALLLLLKASGITEQDIVNNIVRQGMLSPDKARATIATGTYMEELSQLSFENEHRLELGTIEGFIGKALEKAAHARSIAPPASAQNSWISAIEKNAPLGEKTVSLVGLLGKGSEHDGTKAAVIVLAMTGQGLGLKLPNIPHAVLDTRDNTVTVSEKLDIPGLRSGEKMKIADFSPEESPLPQLQNTSPSLAVRP